MTDMSETFGEPIFVYTAKQAVDDGVLVHPYPERWPWLLVTREVFTAIEEKEDGRTLNQKLVPFLQDAIMIVQAGKKKDPSEYLWTKGMEGNVTGQTVWLQLNDAGGFTVMFPHEY